MVKKVSKLILKRHVKAIRWIKQRKRLPFSQGFAINFLIKRYKIPAIRWGFKGSLIGLETKKQFLIWKDMGSSLSFMGIVNK